MGLRERKKERTRRRIEHEALALFSEHGFDGTTVEAIAEAAEISPRTFFSYFPAKEEVVFSLAQEEELERLHRRLAERPAGASAIDGIRAWIVDVISQDEAADEREVTRRRLIRQTPALAAYEVAHIDSRFQELFARAIAEDMGTDPSAAGPRMVAAAASAALRAVADYYVDSDSELEPEAVIGDAVAFLEAGLEALGGRGADRGSG